MRKRRTYLVMTSDWHIDWRTSGVDRANDVQAAVWESVLTAISLRAEEGGEVHYLFGGDLMNPDAGSRVFGGLTFALKVAGELSRHGIASHWLAGNHDVIEDGSGLTSLSPLTEGSQLVRVHERPCVCNFERFTLVALPFTATSHRYDAAGWCRSLVLPNLPTFVLSHLQLEGMHPGDEAGELARGRDVAFPAEALEAVIPPSGATVLQGHYHRAQRRTQGRLDVVVAGAVARLTHGEEDHAPRFLVVEVP